MKTVKEIINKYDLNSQEKIEFKLFDKWNHKIPKGWYGFDLEGTPCVWWQIIDEFLDEVNKECPDFEIQQVKLKFGQIRCYIQLNTTPEKSKEINKEISELENILFDKNLIY